MLLFDEIYVHQHIDYANGKFQGLTFDGQKPCKSVLSFMIKSLSSIYSDVIALVPIASLTIETLERHFMEALQLAIDGGFSVIGSCCDNHTVNRCFLKSRLGCAGVNGKVHHPLNPERTFFMLLDPTNNLKTFITISKRPSFFTSLRLTSTQMRRLNSLTLKPCINSSQAPTFEWHTS